jgi:septal ring factor EnvC (AmiA/AmiB activator)
MSENKGERLHQLMSELHARAHVQEQPFSSDKPYIGRLLARFRETWNNVATRWYVRPMLQQQNLFNQAVTQVLQELVELNSQLDEMNSHLTQVEEWLISGDKDLTTLARKLAKSEYHLRQWQRQATETWTCLEKPGEKGEQK